ncbi:hypothetical protein ABG067_001672 [Albugo candida]
MIDQETRWLEAGVQTNKLTLTTAESFDRELKCRYPRQRQVIHDQGTEFTGAEFQELLSSYGIKDKPITSTNPKRTLYKSNFTILSASLARKACGADSPSASQGIVTPVSYPKDSRFNCKTIAGEVRPRLICCLVTT